MVDGVFIYVLSLLILPVFKYITVLKHFPLNN